MPTEIMRDAFGHVSRPCIANKCDERYLHKYTYKADHESLALVLSDEDVEPLDLVEMTQSYKNECGIEAMKLLLKSGQASPEDFADDGTGSADSTQFPTNLNDAYQASLETRKAASKSVASLGGSLESAIASGNLDEYVKGLVNEQIKKMQVAQPANEVTDNAK